MVLCGLGIEGGVVEDEIVYWFVVSCIVDV